MTWVKICGITNLDDALMAADAGADALGFIFYDKSPRKIDVAAAKRIVSQMPKTLDKFGVFVNEDDATVCQVANDAGLTGVQLHGDDLDPELPERIRKRGPELKIVVGVPMLQSGPEIAAAKVRGDIVHAFLLDAATSSKHGGTGKTFDWKATQLSTEAIAKLGRVIVAGGLNPGNVAEAIRILKPWGVDVASGVEAAPGKKDPHKVRAFISTAKNRDMKSANQTLEKKI
jgi:phosphoribosylanthranilate isomerase